MRVGARPRRWPRRIAVILLAVAVVPTAAYTLDRLYPPDLSRFAATATQILDRDGRLVALRPADGGIWRIATTPNEVSPAFLDLLIHTEDHRFWEHPGVDPIALARAGAQMIRARHVVSGGSTLAMQAARLLEPRPRTLRSKLIEAARALQLEWRYGKRGVLSIWLTLAPYGGNLEGVQAGARAWFGVSAASLDPAAAALLVAMPRRPEALRPDRHPDRARRLRDRVLAEAEGVPVPIRRLPLPHHAAQLLAALPPGPIVRTTLDEPLQAGLERTAAEFRRELPEHASLAILVADVASREIRAAVSGRWGDEASGGDIDLTRGVRSPGSALKPFLYALAFRDGVARPETTLNDLPRHFGGYAPENFDRSHAGPVSAANALRRSLNLPAVALLDRVGPLRFEEALAAAGARARLPQGADPSLPLALGGAGLTLREMVGLYAGLVGGGDGPLTLLPMPPVPRRAPDEAARLVAAILTRPLPDLGPAGVAWKTGTSWGGRDAWAFGVDRRHAVGVWVGRPDGTPLPGATGLHLAVPILSQVFSILPAAPRPTPPRFGMVQAALADGGLRLLFPPPDATLSADGPITLRAMGGRRPLTFLVDGAPLDGEPAKREADWLPASPGFYTVIVMDADGLSARAPVRVR